MKERKKQRKEENLTKERKKLKKRERKNIERKLQE